MVAGRAGAIGLAARVVRRRYAVLALGAAALGFPSLPAAAADRLCLVTEGSWNSGNFPGVADCQAGDIAAVLLPAQYPLVIAIGRFCDMSRPVATDRVVQGDGSTVNSFVCTYGGSVRPMPKGTRP